MPKNQEYPENFEQYQEKFEAMFLAFQEGGKLARQSGPLSEKTTHLLQLAAAIAIRSEGAVHSHTRRALEHGASREEIYQVVNLLISTVGFPTAAAGFSWVSDTLRAE